MTSSAAGRYRWIPDTYPIMHRSPPKLADRRALRNGIHRRKEILSFGLRIVYAGLAFLTTVLLARLLGPAPLGKYFEIVAWVLLVGAVVQSGWSIFLVREVAALRETGRIPELAGLIWLCTLIVGAISIAAALSMVLIAYVTGTDAATMRIVLIAAVIIPLLATSTVRQAVARGMGWPLLGQICESLVRPGIQMTGLLCVALGLVFAAGLDPTGAISILLLATIAAAVLAFAIERRATADIRRTGPRKVPRASEWLGSFTHNALIGWSSAVNLQIGTLVLANMATDPLVADFRIAQQLALLMSIGFTAVGTLHAAELSRSYSRGDLRSLQALVRRASLFSLAAALPLAMGYIVLGRPGIALVFGPEFAGAYAPLLILIVGQLVNAAFGLGTIIAVATRSEAFALRAHVVSAVCNVAVSILLVPLLGTVGAALGSTFSLIVWNLLLYLYLKRNFGISSIASFRSDARNRTDPPYDSRTGAGSEDDSLLADEIAP